MVRVAIRWAVRLSAVVACTGVMALTILVCYEVFTRYVLGHPTIWVGEICSYLLIWIGLLAVIVALADERHLRVDLVFVRFPRKVQDSLNIFTSLLMLAFSGIILWKGSLYFWEAYIKGWEHYGMLYLPMAYTRIVVPLTGIILCVQIILKTYDYVLSFREKVT